MSWLPRLKAVKKVYLINFLNCFLSSPCAAWAYTVSLVQAAQASGKKPGYPGLLLKASLSAGYPAQTWGTPPNPLFKTIS